jgi:hypothetical protein
MLLHHSPKGDNRQAVEAGLGSIAITGTADTIMAMRKTDHYRTIISEGREEGGFTDETTLAFDEATRRVTLGVTRKEADEREAATTILEWLGTQTDPVAERVIHDAVEGRKATKERALRRLFEEGKIIRTGGGKRGRPSLGAGRLVAISPRLDYLSCIVTGKELRAIREDLFGERQVDFAKRLGLTSNHLARIERGEVPVMPTVEILAKLIAKGRRPKRPTR